MINFKYVNMPRTNETVEKFIPRRDLSNARRVHIASD